MEEPCTAVEGSTMEQLAIMEGRVMARFVVRRIALSALPIFRPGFLQIADF